MLYELLTGPRQRRAGGSSLMWDNEVTTGSTTRLLTGKPLPSSCWKTPNLCQPATDAVWSMMLLPLPAQTGCLTPPPSSEPTVTYTESGTPTLNWDSRYLCHFSTWNGWNLVSRHMFSRCLDIPKFQLFISCTFIVMKVFVAYLVISTKCFITMKVQEI